MTNRFRREHGRGALHRNPKLKKSAQEFAVYLARTNKFSHTADGHQPWDRTAAQGYADCIIAENIAWELNPEGFSTRGPAQALVTGWEKSPHHRRNMLDADLDEIGVGVAFSKSSGRYYAVQDFGRPKSEELTFSLTNESEATISYSVDGKDFSLKPRYTVTHHRCRPAKLIVHLSQGTEGKPAKKDATFHPDRGVHYLIQKGPGGRLTVAEE